MEKKKLRSKISCLGTFQLAAAKSPGFYEPSSPLKKTTSIWKGYTGCKATHQFGPDFFGVRFPDFGDLSALPARCAGRPENLRKKQTYRWGAPEVRWQAVLDVCFLPRLYTHISGAICQSSIFTSWEYSLKNHISATTQEQTMWHHFTSSS